MARRVMFVQLKTGHDIDRGPSWIGWVEFTRTWRTARYRGMELRRFPGVDSNFYDVETGDDYWISGPKRDRSDTRYGPAETEVDADVRQVYEAFLAGEALPGRAQG